MDPVVAKPGADLSVSSVLKEAWALVDGCKGAFVGATAVVIVGTFFAQRIFTGILGDAGVTGFLANVLGSGVSYFLGAGLIAMGLKRATGATVSWTDVTAHSDKVMELLIAGFLTSVLTTLGYLLLVIPGIFLSIVYIMTTPLILDKGLRGWDAMESSRKIVTAHFIPCAVLLLVTGVIVLLSMLPALIGLIWTGPLSAIALGVTYRRLIA